MAAARTTTTSRRRRPLQTCAASMSGVIDTAYKRSGSLGNFTKHLTTSATSTIPFASTMQHLGQTMISLTDDHILFLERITESVFPPAGRVFDKIDELVYSVVEELPHRFDKALLNTDFIFIPPSMMHQIPFLDWILLHLIWWLNFLISILTHWGSRIAKEKDIMIDTSFDLCCSDPIESPKKTDSSSGEAQEKFMLSSTGEFTESPDIAEPTTEFTESENIDEALGQSMVSTNKLAESTDKENVDEAQSQSMVSSNKFAESTDEENLDEALGPSMVSSNELVESAKTENYAETQEQSMLPMRNDEEKPVSKKTTETEEVEKKNEQLLDTKEFEKEPPPLSPTESFVSAHYEYITSSSAAGGDSFLDDEPFEHVELPMISTDEDENNDNFVPVSMPGNEKSVAAIASSSSKNKARKKKAIRKDDQHKILELLEAKWHMM